MKIKKKWGRGSGQGGYERRIKVLGCNFYYYYFLLFFFFYLFFFWGGGGGGSGCMVMVDVNEEVKFCENSKQIRGGGGGGVGSVRWSWWI